MKKDRLEQRPIKKENDSEISTKKRKELAMYFKDEFNVETG